ncbi:MAG: hypothetical protein ACXACR_16015, partial [Candidatus Hodarchaeales archaeon]
RVSKLIILNCPHPVAIKLINHSYYLCSVTAKLYLTGWRNDFNFFRLSASKDLKFPVQVKSKSMSKS